MGAGDHGSMHVFIILFMFIRSEQLTTMSSKYNTRKPIFKKYNKSRKHVNKTKKMHRNKGKKGGAYDTNQYFVFPVFNVNDVIKFQTLGGATCCIGKNPNALQNLCSVHDITRLTQIETKVNEINPIKTDDPTGMFLLYGTDIITTKHGTLAHYYGLFFLLSRIQLLAILLQLKSNPRFSSIDVSFPIYDTSVLPKDYNNSPHGYRWYDTEVANLSSFIAFSQHMKEIETKLLDSFQLPSDTIGDVQREILSGLEIPSFLQMVRMTRSKIDTEHLKNLRKTEAEKKMREETLKRNKEVNDAISFFNNLIQKYKATPSTNSSFNKLKPLSISSSPSEIAVAYKSIALLVHPDKGDIDRDTFQTLRNHYTVLKDQYQIAGKKKTKLRK